jgi:hypothetical protein
VIRYCEAVEQDSLGSRSASQEMSENQWDTLKAYDKSALTRRRQKPQRLVERFQRSVDDGKSFPRVRCATLGYLVEPLRGTSGGTP